MVKVLNSTVSHDMRGPLQSVNLISKILLDTPEIDEGSKKLIKSIRNASLMLEIQVNDLLDNSLLERGLFTARLEVFSVKESFEEVISVVSLQAQLHHSSIRFLMSRSMPKKI